MAKTFNRLRHDTDHRIIHTPLGFLTQDATSPTTNKSPLAITTGVTTIAIPTNAAEIAFISDVAIRVSEDSAVSTRYFARSANSPMTLGVAEMDEIYIRTETGSGTLNFYFNYT